MAEDKSGGEDSAAPPGTKQGTVRAFDTERGSGEIEADNGEVLKVFRSALRDEALSGLYPGDIVSFLVGRDRFGRRVAQEVRRIGWDEGEDPDAPPREWTFYGDSPPIPSISHDAAPARRSARPARSIPPGGACGRG